MSGIQWFPGHMTKALRTIEDSIKSVDTVIEVVDARVALSGRSPELVAVTARRPRIIVLNKSDLADPAVTERWLALFRSEGATAVSLTARDGQIKQQIIKAVSDCLRKNEIKVKYKPRAMVVGVPNSGKSTLINALAKSAALKTEDRPGVTRGKQWVVLDELELLDMPGVLTKKFESAKDAQLLAYTGAVRDEVIDMEELACGLIAILTPLYPSALAERYALSDEELAQPPYELLEIIARKRGMVKRGGVADTERAAIMLIDEFRGGRLGRISLERPSNG